MTAAGEIAKAMIDGLLVVPLAVEVRQVLWTRQARTRSETFCASLELKTNPLLEDWRKADHYGC